MKAKTRQVQITAFLAALQITTAQADTLLRWDFSNDALQNGDAVTAAADFIAPNIASATITRGSRATPATVGGNNGRGAFATNTGEQDADLASALANGSYYSMTVAPQAGSTMSLTGMDIATFTQNTSASFTFQVVFSKDGFATSTSAGIINPVNPNYDGILSTLALSGFPALQNTTSTVEFRVAYYGTGVGYEGRGLGQIASSNNDISFYGSVVSSLPLTVTTTTLPSGINGLPYTQNLVATGGTAPLTWSISSGSLPAGLSLTSEGIIEGTPTTNGISNFTVLARDSKLPTASTDTQTLSITINAPPPPTITTTSIPNSTLGASYFQTLANIDGIGPFTWTLSSGSLPAGLTLSPEGVIEGTTAALGTSTFTVRVTDSSSPIAGTDTQVYSVTVSESIIAWDFSNDVAIDGNALTAVPDTVKTGLQTPALNRGAKFTAANVSFTTGRGAFATDSDSAGADLDFALAQGAYVSLTLAPQAGFKFSLTSVDLAVFTQNVGGLIFDVAFSTDGFATYTSAGTITAVSSNWNGTLRSLNLNAFPALQNVTAASGVEFRIAIYGDGAYQQRGFGQIIGANNDIAFNGTVTSTGAGSYTTWAASNGVTGGQTGDSDKDGISNLTEYALQTNPNGSDGSVGVLSGSTISFTKRAIAVTNGDVIYEIESSPTLGAAPSPWVVISPAVNSSTTISYSFPPGPRAAFVRLKLRTP